MKWMSALPQRDKSKLEAALSKSASPEAQKEAFVASAEADSTKTRAARRKALLDAAAAVSH